MCDALIAKKKAGSPQTRISLLAFREAAGDNLTQKIQTRKYGLMNKFQSREKEGNRGELPWYLRRRLAAAGGGGGESACA